ncbi:MAG: zinc ribbon domain-containing protein [Anaerolineales bacterium]
MDFGSILLAVALLLLVGAFVARPLLQRVDANAKRQTERDKLEAEREVVLTALRELDFDHATGKVGEEDYAAQRAVLVAQGVALLKQLDALPSPEAELEAEVRAARSKLPRRASTSPTCPNCGHPPQPGDRFCVNCGTPLALERAG